MVEKTTVFVKINNDGQNEAGSPESFKLVLSTPPGSSVVFGIHQITISIVDDDG